MKIRGTAGRPLRVAALRRAAVPPRFRLASRAELGVTGPASGCIVIHTMVSELKRYNFHVRLEQLDALRRIEKRDGVLVSEQIRRAIDLWLKTRRAPEAKHRRPSA
jgi:hypothetical protein